MGLPMAKNILSKKFKLNVWNRTPGKTLELEKKGAKVFKDIKDLVQNSKVIVSMLANDDVCKAILIKKIQSYLKKGQIVIDMSSTTQNTALEIGKTLKKKKVFFLDAPVSGGTIGAEKGTLAIMVGGDKKIFNTVMPLFKSMGTAIYVGKTGCGQVAKLANQTIVGISIGAVSEALILAEAAGEEEVVALAMSLPRRPMPGSHLCRAAHEAGDCIPKRADVRTSQRPCNCLHLSTMC